MTRLELIQEITNRSSRELTEKCANDLVREISCHLEQDIQSRLELGLTPEEAEAEAVACIGSPRELVSAIRKANPKSAKALRMDPGVLYATIAGHFVTAGFVVLNFAGIAVVETLLNLYLLLYTATAIWLFYKSWNARRLQILVALALILPATVFTSLGLSWSLYADPGFNTYVGTPKKEIPRLVDEAQQRMRAYQVSSMTFDKEFEAYLAGVRNGTVSGEKALMAPRWIATYNRYDMYRFENSELARSAWIRAAGLVHEFNSVNRIRDMETARNLQELGERPLIVNWFFHLPSGAYFAGGYAFLMLGVSALAWLFRSIYEVMQLPWRRTKA